MSNGSPPTEQEEYQRFKQQVDEQTASARSSFEAQLQAERDRALQEYRGQLPAYVESVLAQREAQARSQFERDLEEQTGSAERSFLRAMSIRQHEAEEQFRQSWLGISSMETAREQQSLAQMRARMRIEAARSGAPYSPRGIIQYEIERAQLYREQMASAETTQKSKFEEELAGWEKEEKETFAGSLATHILDARSFLETSIQQWKPTERAELEQQAQAQVTSELTQWELSQREALEKEVSSYTLQTESIWQVAAAKYRVELAAYEAEVKAVEVKLKDWKASLPKDYKAEKINGDWVAYPSDYMPPEKQPDGTYVSKPVPQGFTYDPKTKQLVPYTVAVPITETDILTVAAIAFPFIAPKILPATLGITTGKILTGAIINIAVSEAASYILAGQPLPAEQLPYVAFLGEVAPIVTTGITAAVGKVVPWAVENLAGRTILSAGIGAGYGYILSPPEERLKGALTGAAFGAGFSLGWELVAQPLVAQAKLKLGLATPMRSGAPTLGKTGEEVGTWISEPVEALGGKRIRVVSDVTELPVGVGDITKESMILDYVGKETATAHATLTPQYFKTRAGQVTELVGIPSQASGWRSYQEWYHFYSAPSVQDEFVTIYGGYMGVGEGYSGSVPRVIMGGKPTALVTTKTFITPEMLPVAGEGIDDYLTRVSTTLGGETGLDPALALGVVGERQVITPASYIRKGEPTFGSLFISEGRAGQFIIQDLPEGLLGKIPVLRTMFSKYTTVDVIVGSFAPAEYKPTGKPASMVMTGMGERVISVPSVPSLFSSFVFSPSEISGISRAAVSSPVVSAPSVPSAPRSLISLSSQPSMPSLGVSAPSLVSKPSKPSKPSIPSLASYLVSTPSVPSTPSLPSLPSYPSAPSYPSVGSVILQPPSRREGAVRRRKKVKPSYLPSIGRFEVLYPVKTTSEVANYVFGEFKKPSSKRSSRRHKK